MFKGQIALIIRIVLFMAAAIVAALPFAGFDQATGVLTVDLSGASKYVAGLLWTGIGGGVFTWSRLAKAAGGQT